MHGILGIRSLEVTYHFKAGAVRIAINFLCCCRHLYHNVVGGYLEMRDLGFYFNGESIHLDFEAFRYM